LLARVKELEEYAEDIEDLISSTKIATIFLDEQLRIKRFTPSATSIYRLGKNDLGRSISDVPSFLSAPKLVPMLHEVQVCNQSRELEAEHTESGATYLVKISPYRHSSKKVKGVSITCMDVSEMKEDQYRAELREQVQTLLSELALYALRETELTPLFRQVCKRLKGTARADMVKVLQHRPGKHDLILRSKLGYNESEPGEATIPDSADYQAGYALTKMEAVVVTNYLEQDQFKRSEVLERDDAISGICVCIPGEERPWGVLALHCRVPRVWMPELMEMIQSTAQLLAFAINRHRQRQRLARSERHFRNLADAMPQCVWITDSEGKVNFLNKLWREYTGTSQEELMGLNKWPEVIHPDHRQAASRAFHHSVETGEPYEIEYPLRRHDGTYRWHLARGMPVRDENGQINYWFGTSTDIEMQKQAQQELNLSSQRKDRFLAMLGHELRNPLAAIRNCSHVLNREEVRPDQVSDCLEIIERQGAHLTRLVDDLLDISRISSGRIELRQENHDLREIIQNVVEDYTVLIEEKDLKLEVEIPEDTVPIHGDETRIAQCLGNIIHNAYKFSPQGETVEITCRVEDNIAVIRVSDHGLGMDSIRLGKIFNPYESEQQSVPNSSGLGLGLSVAKGLIELHGGSVDAHSDGPGKGSDFTIRLPICDEEPAPKKPAGPPPRRQQRESATILLIEDDFNAARSIEMFFELEGDEVHIASNAQDAIERAADLQPDVIICDICLPDALGFEVMQKLRQNERLEKTRTVAMSGLSRNSDREKALEAGFDAFIVKPPDPEQLLEACFPASDANDT